ncbi:MAG: aldose 1-epimerase [Sphingomonas sp.]
MATPMAAPDQALTVRAGDAVCTISPECGGSIASWTISGQHLLRAASAADVAARAPLGMAGFPLVPYSNRIADGRFDWQGERIKLSRNFAPEPHAIHGIGWQRAWQVSDTSETEVALDLVHVANADWPWPFRATQRIALTPTALILSLRVTNLHTHPVPLAFGHHPYFDATGATLHFTAETLWTNDARALPSGATSPAGVFDFGDGAPVEGRVVDHCYTGWDGAARIDWADRLWRLHITTVPALPAAVVYIPRGGDIFCFEPVPHINDALNRNGADAAMPVIGPGESYAVEISFQAVL